MLNLSTDQLDQVSDKLGEKLSPHAHMAVAEAIKEVVPDFNSDKFLARCMTTWEGINLVTIDDDIPY